MGDVYDIGDVVRLAGSFQGSAGPLDPGSVTGRFRIASAQPTSYTYGVDPQLVRDAVGQYHFDVEATESGTWYYRFESSGIGQAAAEGTFRVRRSRFLPP